jgi:hypothetical protein
MRYSAPNFPGEFEIPNDWLTGTGIDSFAPSAEAYGDGLMAIFMPCRQRFERARDRRSTFSSDILARHCQATKNSRRLSLLAGLRPLHQFGTYQPAPMSHFPENYSHTLEVGGLPKLNAATLSPIYQGS